MENAIVDVLGHPAFIARCSKESFREANKARGGGGWGDSCGKSAWRDPARRKPEEAQRAPAESESFPAGPIHSHKSLEIKSLRVLPNSGMPFSAIVMF